MHSPKISITLPDETLVRLDKYIQDSSGEEVLDSGRNRSKHISRAVKLFLNFVEDKPTRGFTKDTLVLPVHMRRCRFKILQEYLDEDGISISEFVNMAIAIVCNDEKSLAGILLSKATIINVRGWVKKQERILEEVDD